MRKKILLLLLVALMLGGCKSKFTKKYHYVAATDYLEQGRVTEAIHALPKLEKNTFIAVMERAYLQLIRGVPDIKALQKYARKIENRVRYEASRELKTFFYLETPEGYYASEHEVIWLHMLLSWGYSMQGKYEKAYVEAKKSANLLNNNWSMKGRFDDPTLRIMLGALWAYCGHWEEAQVDFRVAYNMNKKLRFARKLANMDKAPDTLFLVLGGPGPEPTWNPELTINPFRGFRGVNFRGRGKKSRLQIIQSNRRRISLNLTPDSSAWYKRHFERDNEIHNLIQDSRYGQVMLLAGAQTAAHSTAGVLAGIGIGLGALAVGGAVIYFSAQGGSGEGMVAGGVIIIAGIKFAYEVARGMINDGIRASKKTLDISRTYRFVRFLPEYAWVGWNKKAPEYPLSFQTKRRKEMFRIEAPPKRNEKKGDETQDRKTQVIIKFFPDMGYALDKRLINKERNKEQNNQDWRDR